MIVLPYIFNLLYNKGTQALRGNNTTSNPAQQTTSSTLNPQDNGSFYVGQVLRAGAGLYDVEVQGDNLINSACNIMCQLSSYFYGYSEGSIPIEGSRVMIHMPYKGSQYGVIMGVVPTTDMGNPMLPDSKPMAYSAQYIDNEPGASSATEKAYRKPWADKKYNSKRNANAGRPLDLVPGNKAWVNEQGIGISMLNLIMSLRATERAKIELGVLDDTIRIVSGYMRHISAQGDEQIYNDGGFVTHIVTGTSWQSEKSGFSKIGSPLTKEEGESPFIAKSEHSRYNLANAGQDSMKRFQWMAGHLGDMLNYFIANPDPAVEQSTRDYDNLDQGLLHAHAASSGRVIMRSAGGISLQRWDRLPVPKRKFEAWDPKGDKLENEDPITEKKPFEVPEDHPYARSLILRDMMAWYHKQSYQRIHEISQAATPAHKDFYLPEERDMHVPKDDYDPQGKASEPFEKNDLRNSFVNIEPDGSIVIRDAWGSELIMRGGNIILNCAGQIELRSGGSIVQLAGHDIIAKAHKSVDIVATDNDVRIKANSNLQLVSEGRTGSNGGGGILLESRSKNEGVNFDGTGEQAYSSGIIMKAEHSRVYMQGKRVHTSATEQIMMDTFDSTEKNVGQILMSAKQIIGSGDDLIALSASKTTAMYLQPDQAVLVGPNAGLIAEHSAYVIYGSKAAGWIPITMDGPNVPFYDVIQPYIEVVYDLLQVVDWIKPFDPLSVVNIEFTYRSSEEYGTVNPTEVQGGTRFYVYQAAWTYLANNGSELVPVTVETWKDYPIRETYAWPGVKYYSGDEGAYVKYDKEVNIGEVSGIPKIRSELVRTPGTLDVVPFSQYEVVKH